MLLCDSLYMTNESSTSWLRNMVKKVNNKKSGNKKKVNSLLRVHIGTGFPRQLCVRHKYADETTLTSTLGVMANYRFRTNGMFDPNHTSTGHQPSYYDVLAGVYDHWIITKSTISITMFPTTTVVTPYAFGLAINDDTSTLNTSYVAYSESSFCKVKYIAVGNVAPKVLTMTWNSPLVFAGETLGNPELWGSVASDPTEEQIFNVFLQAVDQVSTATTLFVAHIEYEAMWFELKDLVVS